MNWKKRHQISAKRARSLARNGETSGARNQESAYRLTVQSFQRKFDPTDPKKQNERLPETLIQQIDTMSAVASAFRILLRCQRNKMKHLML
jgi:hypothetical protein